MTPSRPMGIFSVLALIFLTYPVFGRDPVSAIGFKDLTLGMTERSVGRARKLSCLRGDTSALLRLGKNPSKLEREEARLRALSGGDRYCTSHDSDTIGGMPISSMQLRFLDGELGKIDIDINEKGISTVTGLGYGVWSSDNLTTLVTLLDSRYGRHSLKTKLVCDHAGRCGRAPTQKTFTWSPLNSTVTLTYVESTNNTNPKLTFLSTKFATETDALRARAWRVREQIDQEERAAKDKTMRARGNDL